MVQPWQSILDSDASFWRVSFNSYHVRKTACFQNNPLSENMRKLIPFHKQNQSVVAKFQQKKNTLVYPQNPKIKNYLINKINGFRLFSKKKIISFHVSTEGARRPRRGNVGPLGGKTGHGVARLALRGPKPATAWQGLPYGEQNLPRRGRFWLSEGIHCHAVAVGRPLFLHEKNEQKTENYIFKIK